MCGFPAELTVCLLCWGSADNRFQTMQLMKIPWVSSCYDSYCSFFLLFPFLSPVDKMIYFCQTWQSGVPWNRQVMILLTHLCWLFSQHSKAPTPAGCSSILILPSPNQDKTPPISKTTQVVLMPRILQWHSSACHTREQECHFKNVFFCCQAAGASKQFLAACAFMQFDACVFRVYTLMLVSGSLQ